MTPNELITYLSELIDLEGVPCLLTQELCEAIQAAADRLAAEEVQP